MFSFLFINFSLSFFRQLWQCGFYGLRNPKVWVQLLWVTFMNKKQKKGSDHAINFFIFFFIRSDTFNSPFYLNELSDLKEFHIIIKKCKQTNVYYRVV